MQKTVCLIFLFAIMGMAYASSDLVTLRAKMDGRYICYDLDLGRIYKSSTYEGIPCQYHWIEYSEQGVPLLHLTTAEDPSIYVSNASHYDDVQLTTDTDYVAWSAIHRPSDASNANIVVIKEAGFQRSGRYMYATTYSPYGEEVGNYLQLNGYSSSRDPHKFFIVEPPPQQ